MNFVELQQFTEDEGKAEGYLRYNHRNRDIYDDVVKYLSEYRLVASIE